MNLALTDPFILAQDYPDILVGKLKSGHCSCIKFNRKGDFLAAGRLDGTVVVFDIETQGVAHKLKGHAKQIQSLSWSRDGRYLLSASQDWKCILWDLQDGSPVRTIRFNAPVYIAELHPFNHWLFVASLFEEQPYLVDISNERPVRRALPSLPLRLQVDSDNADAKPSAKDGKHVTCVTIFTDIGNHVIAGTSKGWINIIETQTCSTIHSTKLCNAMNIMLRLGSNGRDLVVNSSDSVIRTIILPELKELGLSLQPANIKLEVEHKFQDLVNRLAWNHVAFSSTGEYVTASTYMNSDIYIWERVQGSLVRILEGPKEEMGVVEWHPSRPMVAACGLETGRVWLWSITTPQKWSALAPDFQEVEENVLYQEQEDEFDMAPPEATHQRRLDMEDEEVDVLTIEPIKGDVIEIEKEFRMPTVLDIEDSESEHDVVAVGPGQLRRRSPGREDAGLDSGLEDAKRSTPTAKTTTRRKR